MNTQQRQRMLARAACLALGATALLGAGWQLFKTPDPDVERGNKLVRKGKPAEALKAYEKAEKRLGRRHRLDYNRGLAYFGTGKYEKARESFLSASGATDEVLRKKAFYNLANTLFRLAEPTLKKAGAINAKVKLALKQVAELAGPEKQQQRCQAMQGALQAIKGATAANKGVEESFKEARNEYRLVLLKDAKHFNTKWNLELCLRHMGAARAANQRLEKLAEELGERFKKECKPPEDKNKKKNQDKQKQDKQNQDKQKQDKQKQDKQNQDKQKQDKQNQQSPKDPKQKPLTKEDIAKRKAGKRLDDLERKQRNRDRDRDRNRTTRRPLKDW